MKFSIITVCLNSEKTIIYTLNSILNQTYKNIEHIIIDGGSTDRTLDIIKKYPLKNKKVFSTNQKEYIVLLMKASKELLVNIFLFFILTMFIKIIIYWNNYQK